MEDEYTEVFVWGANIHGQLGLGKDQSHKNYSLPKFCSFNVAIRKVSCGEEHSAFITSNGSMYTMGKNSDGRLGIGDRSVKFSNLPCLVEGLSCFNTVEIACGFGHSVAIMDNGKAFAWGLGEYGALGTADCNSQWFPVQVTFAEKSKVSIRKVSCGTRHTAMVDANGRLFVCGSGDAGQLGTGLRQRELRPVHISSIKDKITNIACGIFHTLILTSSGKVLATGGNNFGQLGVGNKRSSTVPLMVKELENVIKVSAGNMSAAITDKGNLYVWGTGAIGEYLVPTLLKGIECTVKEIEMKNNFGAAVNSKGKVYTWGSNDNGELGQGDYLSRSQATLVKALQGKIVTSITCGGGYAIALGRTIPNKRITKNLEKELKEMHERSTKAKWGNEKKEESKVVLEKSIFEPKEEEEYKHLLEVYEAECKQREDLERKVGELQRHSYNSNGNEKNLIQLTNHLEMLSTELIREQDKSANLFKELEIERIKLDDDDLKEFTIKELEELIEKLQWENKRIQKSGESTRLSELLNEYEVKIEKEIEDRRRVSKEKGMEIKSLHEIVYQLENSVTSLQDNKTKLAEAYLEELKDMKLNASKKKNTLEVKMAETENLTLIKQDKEAKNRALGLDLEKINEEIEQDKENINELINELEDAKHKIFEKETELNKVKETHEQLMSLRQEKELAHSKILTELKDLITINAKEIEDLNIMLKESTGMNEELNYVIKENTVKVESLKKEVNKWIEAADKTRTENRKLKNLIEELENKNKRLITNIDTEDHRVIIANKPQEAKTCSSRIVKQDTNYVITSPERLDKLIEIERTRLITRGKEPNTQQTYISPFNADKVEEVKKESPQFRSMLKKNYTTPIKDTQQESRESEQVIKATQKLIQTLRAPIGSAHEVYSL